MIQNMNQQPATQSLLLMDQILPTHFFSASSEPTSSVSFPPPPLQPPPPPAKRKRSLPGHPDPESEVIALSPNSLLATNRFMCEICNKGFQRDQNLQLHRRGHNLPWKLKQRAKDEAVRKKVYVCPEPGCVHHDPARALGDLTGIKKHFYRKHGEKKWKCDKCSKKYAVQSDWKAHSKTCGTKEYKCDCGALFSRRDSFITHKAFCDALVEDTARAITSNPFLPPPQQQQEATAHEHNQSPAATSSPAPSQYTNMMFILQNPDQPQQPPPPSNHQTTHIPNLIPPWLLQPPSSSSLLYSGHELMQPPPQNPSHVTPYPPPPPAQAHMSATALLQKAAQLGAIMSTKASTIPLPAANSLGFFGPIDPLGGPGNAVGCGSGGGGSVSSSSPPSSSSSSLLLHEMMLMKSMPNPFDGGMMSAFGNGGISDGLTRDFLGLSPLITQADDHILNLTVAGLADANANAAAATNASSHELV